MPAKRQYLARAGPRDLLYFVHPELWPSRPFLWVVRVPTDGPPEEGLLYDAVGASGKYGLSATVFLTYVSTMPPTEAEFLALPHITYDTAEEMAEDGWIVV